MIYCSGEYLFGNYDCVGAHCVFTMEESNVLPFTWILLIQTGKSNAQSCMLENEGFVKCPTIGGQWIELFCKHYKNQYLSIGSIYLCHIRNERQAIPCWWQWPGQGLELYQQDWQETVLGLVWTDCRSCFPILPEDGGSFIYFLKAVMLHSRCSLVYIQWTCWTSYSAVCA